jgi:hypothetical protein
MAAFLLPGEQLMVLIAATAAQYLPHRRPDARRRQPTVAAI